LSTKCFSCLSDSPGATCAALETFIASLDESGPE
jgi:hypothetical protein